MAIAQEKKVAQGLTLSIAAVSCGQIIDITPPALSISSDVDVTTLDSTFEQFEASRPYNTGELQFNIIWTPGADVDEAHDAALIAYTKVACVITYANLTTSKTWTFTGYLKNIGPPALNGKTVMNRAYTLKLTTAITRG